MVFIKPELVRDLAGLMDQRLEEFGAVCPKPNPEYNPMSKLWVKTGWFPQNAGTSVAHTKSGLELTVTEAEGEFEINLFQTNEYNEQLSFVPSGKNFRLILEITTATQGKGSLYPIQEGSNRPVLKANKDKNKVNFLLTDERNKSTEILFVSVSPLQGINLSFPKGKYVVKSAVLKTVEGENVQQWTF